MKRASQIPRPSISEATAQGLREHALTLDLLRSLSPADWLRPTDCTDWTVRDVVAHMIGQYDGSARPNRMLRRIRAARRRPGHGILDGHNQLQVEERARLTPEELTNQFAFWGTRGIRALSRIPSPLRRLRLSRLFPEAVAMPDDSLDFLIRVIAPRDPWMHRLDLAAAVNRPAEPGAHDASLVAQAIRDVAQTWAGPAVELTLTGPAGGSWLIGEGPPQAQVRAGALDYARHLASRPASPAVVTGDPQVAEAFQAVRVVF
jgi:uncharacterized protein (TIGR03083 family)